MATLPQFEANHQPPDPPSADQVRAHLRHVLESPAFKGSKRSQTFLAYAVEKVLQGEQESLKERNIAVDVYGRPPEANLPDDTIVRVGAREVRRRLAQYYTLPDSGVDSIHFELPAGSYVPEWRVLHEREREAPREQQVNPRSPGRLRLLAWSFGAVALAAIVASPFLLRQDPSEAAFNQFWTPVLKGEGSILFAVPAPVVYHPSQRATLRDEELHPGPPSLGQRPLKLAPKELDGSDIVPVVDQYVGIGDMVAATELTRLFSRWSKPVHMRLSSKLEFTEMREAPTILIGAFTNRWTLELAKAWPIRFGLTPDRRPTIEEVAGQRRVWALPEWKDDGSSKDDYILVARVLKSTTGKPLLAAAGLKQFGTEAGGRILANPAQLGPLLRQLPAGWEQKNLQLVLHAHVIGNAPAAPDLVGWRLW